jgi:hypothetical protein
LNQVLRDDGFDDFAEVLRQFLRRNASPTQLTAGHLLSVAG